MDTVPIRIPVSETYFAEVEAGVVGIDLPSLLGLEVMTMFKVILDFDCDQMRSKCDGWSCPLFAIWVIYIYIDWMLSILHTELELRLINRHLFTPKRNV